MFSSHVAGKDSSILFVKVLVTEQGQLDRWINVLGKINSLARK